MSSPISNTYTALAGADLSAKVGRNVKCTDSQDTGPYAGLEIVALSTDGTTLGAEKHRGCLQVGGESGKVVTIVRGGPARGKAGGAIPATTEWLTTDGDGDYVVAVSGDQGTARYKGAFDAVAGDEIDLDVAFFRLP